MAVCVSNTLKKVLRDCFSNKKMSTLPVEFQTFKLKVMNGSSDF